MNADDDYYSSLFFVSFRYCVPPSRRKENNISNIICFCVRDENKCPPYLIMFFKTNIKKNALKCN